MIVQQRSTPIRRRNGKQQACEPCRKRKLACDHDYPTCHRCQRRKISQQCIYLQPSKAGTAFGTSQPRPENTTSPPSPSRHHGNLDALTITIGGETAPTPGDGVTPGTQWPLFEGTRAWMGPTSFNAVFQENRVQLGQSPSPPTQSDMCLAKLWADYARRRGISSSKWVQLGIEVVRQIPSTEQICDSLFSRHVNPNDGWIRLAAKMVSESLWQTFGSLLEDRREANLERLSSHLCQNHGVTVREDATDANVWLNSFSGKHLQWEALGILFTYWAFGVLSSPAEDPMFIQPDGTVRERREVVTELKNCATSCIELYGDDAADSGNTLMVYLMYKRNILDAALKTDAAPIVWRQHGELAALTMSLGMHRAKVYASDEVPSISSEARKRVFASVFRMDKGIATFTGRPPMFSRRYTTSQSLPLDVTDEVLLAGGEVLARAIASLDENGFNTDGKVYSATILRARTLLALVRDEVLEIALGCNEHDDIVELAARLKTKSSDTYAKFSPNIQYHPDILLDKTMKGSALYARTVTRLEHLENLFLLERLLIKHGGGNMQDLIDISCDMLDLTLVWWKHSNRFAGMHSDLEWLVTSYAAPTAGVLCIELLKQMRSHSLRQTNRSGALESSAPRYNIPRSQTIQNLTLFVGFLDWIQIAETPTTDICSRIRQIVSRVLDEILGGGSGHAGGTGVGGGGGGGGGPGAGAGAIAAPSDHHPSGFASSQVPPERAGPQSTTTTTKTTTAAAAVAVAPEEELQSTASLAQLDTFSTMFDFDNADLWNFELMDTYGWIEG